MTKTRKSGRTYRIAMMAMEAQRSNFTADRRRLEFENSQLRQRVASLQAMRDNVRLVMPAIGDSGAFEVHAPEMMKQGDWESLAQLANIHLRNLSDREPSI